jgi:tryptophan synthase alpha chain
VSLPGAGEGGGLASAFSHGRAALITYLMAGFPDRQTSIACVRAAAEAGADLIELGVPYADPLADGATIAAAAKAAQAALGGFGLAETLSVASELSAVPGMPPIALMTYLNPMLRFGLDRLADEAAEAGVAGAIVPDLPADNPMAVRWRSEAARRGIDTVFLAAPTSTFERLAAVAAASTGFVYCVSSTGVTGERSRLPADLLDLVARVRAAAGPHGLPVAVGFGISTPEQAAEVAGLADGVVVGSAIVKRQAEPDAVRGFIARLAEAVRRA